MGTVDYILFEPDAMEPRSLRPTPTRDEHAWRGPMPRRDCPSDHVPIAAELGWLPPTAEPVAARWSVEEDRAIVKAVHSQAGL